MNGKISLSAARGQATVEFVFVVSMFLLMTMGIIDLGRAVFYNNMLSNAAREGARTGILSSATASEICAAALSQAFAAGVDQSATCASSGTPAVTNAGALTIKVWLGSAPTSNAAGTADKVQLDYTFTPITPIIGQIVGSSLSLEATSSMYVEP